MSPEQKFLIGLGFAGILAGSVGGLAVVDSQRISPLIAQAETDANALSPDVSPEAYQEAYNTRGVYLRGRLARIWSFDPQADAEFANRPEFLQAKAVLAQREDHETRPMKLKMERGLAWREFRDNLVGFLGPVAAIAAGIVSAQGLISSFRRGNDQGSLAISD